MQIDPLTPGNHATSRPIIKDRAARKRQINIISFSMASATFAAKSTVNT